MFFKILPESHAVWGKIWVITLFYYCTLKADEGAGSGDDSAEPQAVGGAAQDKLEDRVDRWERFLQSP